MKKLVVLFLLISTATFAQEPPYIYQQFGYSPQSADVKGLSRSQQAELDNCVKFAKERDDSAKKNPEKMVAIYGKQALEYDYFGVYLTGCLTNETHGKGWSVQEKKGDTWEKIRSRFAARTFMKLDPAQ